MRKLWILFGLVFLIALMSVGAVNAQVCVAPPSQLVGWWPGDGNANDIQGTNPGTLQNGATFAPGKVGQAFSFDGIDDRVDTTKIVNYNVGPGATFDAWFKTTDTNGVIMTDGGGGGGVRGLGLFVENTLKCFQGGVQVNSGLGVSDGQWHHAACTWNGLTTGTVSLYLDGVLVAQGVSNSLQVNPAGMVQIGGNQFFAKLAGLVDEVEVFERVLSLAEIQSIYNAGSAGKCKPAGPVCGNGIVETGEQCDDGNMVSGDGCSATCTTEAGDSDGDGVPNQQDNCPFVANADQSDSDAMVTGDLTFGGTASCIGNSGWGSTCAKAYDNAYASYPDGWIYTTAGTSWTQYSWTDAKVVNKVRILSYYTAGFEPIKDFKVQGSNDGVVWTTLHTGQHPDGVTTFVDHAFTNANAYKHYRIEITSNWPGNGGNERLVLEVEMLGTTGDGVGDACDNCRFVSNPSQSDSDNNCPAPPYTSDPLCGDACQVSCAQPPTQMVSWWPADGNANDIQDGNHGTLQNGATFAPGKVGQAFSFDGVNDRVAVPHNTNLNLESLSAATFEGWFKSTGAGDGSIVAKHQSGSGSTGWFATTGQGCHFGGSAGTYIGNSGWDGVPSSAVNDGNFHHFACVKDGSTYREYLDGVLLVTEGGSATGTPTTLEMEIGSAVQGTALFLQGMVDELEIFHKALTTAEVQALFNAGSAGKCKVPADTIAPTCTISSPASGATFATTSTSVSGTTTDNLETTGVTCNSAPMTLSGSGTSKTFSGTVGLPNEGSNTITCTAGDAASNQGTCSVTVTRDTTPPSIVDAAVTPNIVGTTAQITVTKTVTDATGVASVTAAVKGPSPSTATIGTVSLSRVSGTAQNGVWQGTFTFPSQSSAPDGTYTVEDTATDTLGNSVTQTDGSVILDRTAPTVMIVSITPSFQKPSSSVEVVASASDQTSGFASQSSVTAKDLTTGTSATLTSFSGSLAPGGTGTWTFNQPTALPEGSHMEQVTAIDQAANTNTATGAYTVDGTAPTVGSVTPISATTGQAQTFSAPWTDNLASTISCDFFADGTFVGTATVTGSGTTSGTASFTYTFSGGTHTARFDCTDAAGNIGAGAQTTITVALCGNSAIEPGEQCDDGNTADGDCCSSICQNEPSGSQTCGLGACQSTTAQCTNGAPATCTPGTPSPETCNGIDDDCNGFVDDGDSDGDGIGDCADTCPFTPNPGQEDFDADGAGDVCDPDDDSDGVTDPQDNCPFGDGDLAFTPADTNPDQTDSDGDGLGDNVCDPQVCGNGQTETPEACDDGNTVSGDGCSATCQVEAPTDTDGDGVPNAQDNCPTTPGSADRQGCPVGDKNHVDLHIIDQQKRGDCSGRGSCKFDLSGVHVKVFNRNDPAFQALWTKNPSGTLYAQVFEADTGRISQCTTNSQGDCTAGETTTGDYLVIVKHVDPETGKSIYSGKPKSASDFTSGLAFKDFQIIKVIKKDGSIEFKGGSKVVVTGSYLEVVAPESALWDGIQEVYPFIMTSDSEWTVDVCTQVPTGYSVVGAYDENGNLITNSECVQAFVAGQTKVVAFQLKEVSSPEPNVKTTITVKHKKTGKTKTFSINIPGKKQVKAQSKAVQGKRALLAGAATTETSRAGTLLVLLGLLVVASAALLALVRKRK